MPFCESVIWEPEGNQTHPGFVQIHISSVVALKPSNCWDLPSLPQDYCPLTVSSLCWWLWGRFAAECAQSCTVWRNYMCEYEREKIHCRHSSLSPVKSPLPRPSPGPWLRFMPWDTAKDHPGMNSNCSSNLILAAPSECLFYCTSQLGPWTSTPGMDLVFSICWIKIAAAVTSCT